MTASCARVLIVEDDFLVSEMIQGMLAGMGYIVVGTAVDGKIVAVDILDNNSRISVTLQLSDPLEEVQVGDLEQQIIERLQEEVSLEFIIWNVVRSPDG